jgi:MFS family permease
MPSKTNSSPNENRSEQISTGILSPGRIKHSGLHSLGRIFSPLRKRNYSLLFSGQLISNVGDAFYWVALPWFMLSGGGGAQALGIALAAYGIPRIGTILLGGSLSDRWRPRKVMLLADVMRALLVGVLALLVMERHPSFWLLCIVLALLGGFAGLFLPATWSITPDILSDDELQAGNALNNISMQIATFVGSGIAGAALGILQVAGTFAMDALTFIVSAVTLSAMRQERKMVAIQGQGTTGEQTNIESASPSTFWQLLRTSRYLRMILSLIVFMNLTGGALFDVALPAFVHNQLKAAASGYGLILASLAIGSLVGALIAGSLGKIRYRYIISLVFFIVEAVALALIPFLTTVVAVAVTMIIVGLMNGLGNVIAVTLTQQILPRHLMGRIMSAFGFTNLGFYPLSVAVGGIVVAHYGSLPIFLLGGVLIAIPAMIGVLQREFRNL